MKQYRVEEVGIQDFWSNQAAPADRGRMTVIQGILSSQRPRLLSCVVSGATM
jgi:hypothetical protein